MGFQECNGKQWNTSGCNILITWNSINILGKHELWLFVLKVIIFLLQQGIKIVFLQSVFHSKFGTKYFEWLLPRLFIYRPYWDVSYYFSTILKSKLHQTHLLIILSYLWLSNATVKIVFSFWFLQRIIYYSYLGYISSSPFIHYFN